MTRNQKTDVAALIRKLEDVLKSRSPALLECVGGPIALTIVEGGGGGGGEPSHWLVELFPEVRIEPKEIPHPALHIGLKPSALRWLIEGTLEVERAFLQHRLAVEGDRRMLERFAACFAPPSSLITTRMLQ